MEMPSGVGGYLRADEDRLIARYVRGVELFTQKRTWSG